MRKIIAAAFAGITLAAAALWAPTAEATDTASADCRRVATADRTLCHRVELQHPYGASYGDGGWTAPNGKAIVHEITHQGLTKTEMHDYLIAEAGNYRQWVTAVPVNMDEITRKCGKPADHAGAWVVSFVKLSGVWATRKHVVCD